MKNLISIVILMLTIGCASKLDYVRPARATKIDNEKIIDRSRDAVWSLSVPELGKQFFVINNLDKSSGLINVSYSGDPEAYVNCGQISIFTKHGSFEKTYTFPGSSARQEYIVSSGVNMVALERKMLLEGRVNLVLEEISATQTKISANARYVLTRSIRSLYPIGSPNNDTISFNSVVGTVFNSTPDGRATECVSTGKLEREILNLVK